MSWEWSWLRLATAVVSGAVLSHGGSLVQLTTRNEMASPSTLGMDGLAVGLVLFLYSLPMLFPGIVVYDLLSLGMVVTVALLLRLVPAPRSSFETSRAGDMRFVLLLGLSVNLMVGALFALLQFVAMAFNHEFPDQLWFGRIEAATPMQLWIGLPLLLILIWRASRYRRQWKAMLLGEGWCRGLGIPVQRITKEALWIAFVGNLWVITQWGAFSFLGLLFPLLLRQMGRYRGRPWRELTEGALLCGVVFGLLDHICYNVTFHGAEIPVGLPAGLLGAAGLVLMLWRRFLSLRVGKDTQRV